MQTTLLPVDRIFNLASLTEGKVRHPHGVYNMGLTHSGGTYTAVFRNCTRNARHLLGWKPMLEGRYDNVLYAARFDGDFKLLQMWPLELPCVVHDVRVSGDGMIGCIRESENQFAPCLLKMESGKLNVHKLQSTELNCKNWNYLPGGYYDCGWMEGRLGRKYRDQYSFTASDIAFCGSAPYFWLKERLITTYHKWALDGDGKRNYFHYFAELEPRAPYRVVRHSCPFKFERGGDPGRIQFLMACFQAPFDGGKKFVVSYGEADADNVVGTIKTADILGLLL